MVSRRAYFEINFPPLRIAAEIDWEWVCVSLMTADECINVAVVCSDCLTYNSLKLMS